MGNIPVHVQNEFTDDELRALVFVGGMQGDVPGSALTSCSDCPNDVWLAPSTVAVITDAIRKGIRPSVVCLLCMLARVDKEQV